MSEMRYRPLIEDMIWSYSRIECFDNCRYKWFLRYIKGWKETPQFYSSYGSFIHKLIEEFYRNNITKEEMKTKFLFDFSKEVKGVRPQESIVEKYIQCGLDYLKHFEPFPFNMVAVEQKVNFDIDGMPFVGYIDYLGERDGEYYIVDNKSRDLKPRSDRKKPTTSDKALDDVLRQLYIYSEAVKQRYGKYPKSLCLNCFKSGTFIEEPFNENAYHEAVKWVKQNIENIKNAEEFYPNRNFFYCMYICGLNDRCCYWQTR